MPCVEIYACCGMLLTHEQMYFRDRVSRLDTCKLSNLFVQLHPIPVGVRALRLV